MSDLLSQDEIDALLHGVDSGAVETEAAPAAGDDRPVSVPESALRETPGWRSRR